MIPTFEYNSDVLLACYLCYQISAQTNRKQPYSSCYASGNQFLSQAPRIPLALLLKVIHQLGNKATSYEVGWLVEWLLIGSSPRKTALGTSMVNLKHYDAKRAEAEGCKKFIQHTYAKTNIGVQAGKFYEGHEQWYALRVARSSERLYPDT